MLKIKDLIDSFDIESAAESASNICRWIGRYGPLSVAEHSCYVHDILHELDAGKIALRIGLIHDLNECISYGDIPSPIKEYMFIEHDDVISSIRRFEEKLNKRIYIKLWGKLPIVYSEYEELIKGVDELSKEAERKFFGLEYEEEVDKFIAKIHGLSAKLAKQEFLKRFEALA